MYRAPSPEFTEYGVAAPGTQGRLNKSKNNFRARTRESSTPTVNDRTAMRNLTVFRDLYYSALTLRKEVVQVNMIDSHIQNRSEVSEA